MNQDSRAQLHSIADKAITTAIQKLFFFHQNTHLIKQNQSNLIEIIKVTVEILKEAQNSKIHIDPKKLAIISKLSEELMFIIQPEEKLSNICHDPDINNAILH